MQTFVLVSENLCFTTGLEALQATWWNIRVVVAKAVFTGPMSNKDGNRGRFGGGGAGVPGHTLILATGYAKMSLFSFFEHATHMWSSHCSALRNYHRNHFSTRAAYKLKIFVAFWNLWLTGHPIVPSLDPRLGNVFQNNLMLPRLEK